MTAKTILKMGNPILREVAEKFFERGNNQS